MKKYILFDLDGTLTDSSEGITKSVQYALDAFDIKEENMDVLKKYIGPPLDYSFRNFHGLEKEKNKFAVKKYRERYEKIGLYENKVYDGIEDMLKKLTDRGYILALATCKPELFSDIIMKYFELDKYFLVMVGCDMSGEKRKHKDQVIEEVFVRLNNKINGDCELTPDILLKMKADSVMIGDRNNDILGAKKCHIDSIGVRYGFATEGELEDAGADYIVDSVNGIINAVEKM